MALGVIPPLCATLGPVLAGPEGCSRGRCRSGPSKWRHTAAPEGRGQGAPRTCRCIETSRPCRCHCRRWSRQGAPRTCRCIETRRPRQRPGRPRRQGAPRTCRCIETSLLVATASAEFYVREHHAPVGALRHRVERFPASYFSVREHHAPVGALRLERDLPLGVAHGSGSTTHL